MNAQSVVLLSSGLDSTYNLFRAHADGQVLLALTINYGQRAALKEIACSRAICQNLKIPHRVLDLPWIQSFGKSALIQPELELPLAKQVQIENLQKSKETAKAVWVPNRNGIFLNIAAGFAEALGANQVVPGFNKEEAATFPDNSSEFMQALDQSLSFSTANQVKVRCYSDHMLKPEIVRGAQELKLPFSSLWPCYQNFDKWCGQCESCLRFKNALRLHQIDLSKEFLL